jgi:hypothetical protein
MTLQRFGSKINILSTKAAVINASSPNGQVKETQTTVLHREIISLLSDCVPSKSSHRPHQLLRIIARSVGQALGFCTVT